MVISCLIFKVLSHKYLLWLIAQSEWGWEQEGEKKNICGAPTHSLKKIREAFLCFHCSHQSGACLQKIYPPTKGGSTCSLRKSQRRKWGVCYVVSTDPSLPWKITLTLCWTVRWSSEILLMNCASSVFCCGPAKPTCSESKQSTLYRPVPCVYW